MKKSRKLKWTQLSDCLFMENYKKGTFWAIAPRKNAKIAPCYNEKYSLNGYIVLAQLIQGNIFDF